MVLGAELWHRNESLSFMHLLKCPWARHWLSVSFMAAALYWPSSWRDYKKRQKYFLFIFLFGFCGTFYAFVWYPTVERWRHNMQQKCMARRKLEMLHFIISALTPKLALWPLRCLVVFFFHNFSHYIFFVMTDFCYLRLYTIL